MNLELNFTGVTPEALFNGMDVKATLADPTVGSRKNFYRSFRGYGVDVESILSERSGRARLE
jgi:hypothetical protein